ncbi:hypothetical protein D3C86_2194370 [compost metagenome]
MVPAQHFQHLRGEPGVRDIIERESDLFSARSLSLDRFRIFAQQLAEGKCFGAFL